MKLSQNDMLTLIRTLRKVEFFSGFTASEVDNMLGTADKKFFKKGEILIKQGEEGRFFFILGSGKVSVHIKCEKNSDVKVGELAAGDYFGETSLITNQPISATIKADEDTEAFILYKYDIQLVMKRNPTASIHMEDTIKRRKEMSCYEISRAPEKKGFFSKMFGK